MYCPKCNAKLSKKAKNMFCWNCGVNLEEANAEAEKAAMELKAAVEQAAPSSPKKSKKKLRNILIIIAVFVIVAVGGSIGGSIVYRNCNAYYYKKGMHQYNDRNYYGAFFTLLKIFDGDRLSRDEILKDRAYYETIVIIMEKCADEMDDVPESYFENNPAIYNAEYVYDFLEDYDYDDYSDYYDPTTD